MSNFSVQGFIDKCTEHGIDSEQLVQSISNWLVKKSQAARTSLMQRSNLNKLRLLKSSKKSEIVDLERLYKEAAKAIAKYEHPKADMKDAVAIEGLFKNSATTDPLVLYEIRKAIARLYRSGKPAYIDMFNEVRSMYPNMSFKDITKAIGEMRSETAAARKASNELAKVKRVAETPKPEAVVETVSDADDMLFPPEVMRATLNKPSSHTDLYPALRWMIQPAKKIRKKSIAKTK